LLAVADPLSHTNTFGYDADGHCLATTNAAQEVTRQTWDARGKLLQLTDGANHTSTRVYDSAGNQTVLTNRNGNPWYFQFDGANRLISTITPMGRSNLFVFNHQGLLTTNIDPAKQISAFSFDAKGRLSSRADTAGTNYYVCDANDNLTSVAEAGNTNFWTYDGNNRVSAYTDIAGNVIRYRYDANGNVTNLVYPGNRTVAYVYDTLNRLTNVTDWAQRKTSIGYDLASHVTSITRPNGSYRTMGYDSAGELTNIVEQMANTLPIAWFRFNWTNSGNMAWEFAAPLPHPVTVPTRTMTYDNDNRLLTFQLGASTPLNVVSDADGNLTSAPLLTNALVTCTFDARNRLSNAGGVTNTYDPAGNRVGITIGTNATVFVINPNAALPQVLLRIKNGVTNYYVYGGAGLLYQVTESATATNTLTYHYDYRGSTIALTGNNGLVTDRIEYSAYGLTTYRAGTNDTPFLFNGKLGVQTDPNGLLYMRARYYNPYLCRFISADPSGFAGGLNHYAYANGNPVSYVDPFGLGAVGESSVDLSWFNAPTPQQTQVQNVLAGFVNFVTLGAANLVSSATTGQDMQGNNLNVADAFQHTLEAGTFVASLALSLPTGGGSLEAEGALEVGLGDAAETTVEINASKLDYLFGNVTSDAHNTARSLQNAAQLNRIGIQNTSEGAQILTENLTSAAQGNANIISAFSKTLPDGSVINLQTRGSLLSGPGGFLKLESTWQVMPDGTMRFSTAIPKGGL
jgi:RHS repeat-associated protein